MKLPADIERKLGMIKATEPTVAVAYSKKANTYRVVIGKEKKEIVGNLAFYKYVEEKLQESFEKKK